MPVVFIKTGRGLTGIIIVIAEFELVSCLDIFWASRYVYLLCTRVELKVSHGHGLCQEFFRILSMQIGFKSTSQPGLWSFCKLWLKRNWLNIWLPILVQRYKYASDNNTVSYDNLSYYDLSTLPFSNYIKHIYWEIFD